MFFLNFMKYFPRFLIFIFLQSIFSAPSILLMPWFGFANPYSLRHFDGLPAEWESFFLLDTASHWLSGVPTTTTINTTDTDSFRALVPLLLFSVLLSISNLPGTSWQATDIILTAASAAYLFEMCLLYKVRRFAAYIACLMVMTSPMAIAFQGGFGLHASHSTSLPIVLALTLKYPTISTTRLGQSLYLAAVYFLSSIMYNYHYLLMPLMFIEALFNRRPLVPAAAIVLYYLLHFSISSLFLLNGHAIVSHNFLNSPFSYL